MLRSTALLVILLASPVLAFSQTLLPSVGGTMSKLSLIPGENKRKLGLVIGLGLEVPIGSTRAIIPELTFIQKGSNSGSSGRWQEVLTLNYLECSVLFKQSLPSKDEKILCSVLIGPYVARGLGGTYRSDENLWSVYWKHRPQGTNFNQDVNYIDNPIDAGFVLGFRISLPKKLFIDLRYSRGLVNLYDNNNHEEFEYFLTDVKNDVLSISAGLPINLSRSKRDSEVKP
jgi:hypothetical protein